ncbi:MAG: AbrB family transcriptional regulator [Coriobacteriaceae bacterium]|nr:AbrB family transcriptional regulator [Coriobacteriaceae bacterium]
MSRMIVTVSSKGQIVLPAEVRKKHGIETGDRFAVVDLAGTIYLVPASRDPVADARGMLGDIEGFSTEALLAERRRDADREKGRPLP